MRQLLAGGPLTWKKGSSKGLSSRWKKGSSATPAGTSLSEPAAQGSTGGGRMGWPGVRKRARGTTFPRAQQNGAAS